MQETKKQRVLIVDDSTDNIQVLMELLKDEYKIIAATNGEKALVLAEQQPRPDIILLDIMMPGIDGYEVCRRLKAQEETRSIPVIFITAMTSNEDEYKGLELGAADYMTKPIIPNLTKVRIRNHLKLKQYQDNLEELVRQRTKRLQLTQSVMIESLGTLAEYRDPETGGHVKRTQNYVKALADHLQKHPRFQEELTSEVIELLYVSAPLHDIGKVGVADSILLKPGKLSDEEFAQMKLHAQYGYEILKKAEITLGADSFIHYAKEIAYCHHEKWNGSGYPRGLSGDDIPLSGRLMALADVYDAHISKRVYKPPFPHEEAIAIITKGKGSHFDPDIVEVFLEIESTFHNIALLYADFDEEREALGGTATATQATQRDTIQHILVVDDNEINLEVMSTQLQHLGFSVDLAANGQLALKSFRQNQYDLILTDLDMPVMDGYELVEAIRKLNPIIPVVAITASDFDLTKEKALKLGFSDYLLKPLDDRRVKALIEKLNGR